MSTSVSSDDPLDGPQAGRRIVITSDDRLFAEGLLRLIVAESSHEVLLTGRASHSGPGEGDILLLDSRMSGALGLCEELSRDRRVAVILFATPEDDAWASHALSVGARGVLARSAGTIDMLRAIRGVCDGVIWAPRRVISDVIDRFSRASRFAPRTVSLLEERLSLREREIFRHAATGLGNKELAARLTISEATVKVHLTHIFQKLGVRGRGELAAAFYGGNASTLVS